MRWIDPAWHCLLAVSAAAQAPPNVLILCVDVGVDQVGAYAESNLPAVTPNIDQLAAQGVLFRYAYANQRCSPTRATIQTGRFAFRTGIGDVVRSGNQALLPSEIKSPLVVQPGREVRVLVNTTDLFATVAELAGLDVTTMAFPKLDSISLVPYLGQSHPLFLRQTVYSEFFAPNGFQPEYFERAIRNERYKLVRTPSLEQLYDLFIDPYELAPLDLGNLSARRGSA